MAVCWLWLWSGTVDGGVLWVTAMEDRRPARQDDRPPVLRGTPHHRVMGDKGGTPMDWPILLYALLPIVLLGLLIVALHMALAALQVRAGGGDRGGRGRAIGDAVVRLVNAVGLYAVLAGGAFIALGAVWPRYHAHADGQTGMGTGLLGVGAVLLGAILLGASLGRLWRTRGDARRGATDRRARGWVVLGAALAAALAAGLVAQGGVDAMDGRAVWSFASMGGIAGVLGVCAPRGWPARDQATT